MISYLSKHLTLFLGWISSFSVVLQPIKKYDLLQYNKTIKISKIYNLIKIYNFLFNYGTLRGLLVLSSPLTFTSHWGEAITLKFQSVDDVSGLGITWLFSLGFLPFFFWGFPPLSSVVHAISLPPFYSHDLFNNPIFIHSMEISYPFQPSDLYFSCYIFQIFK